MNIVKIVIIALMLFIVTGFMAYLIDGILLRHVGWIGRFESLWDYFRKIDQKRGNITVVIWSVTWVLLMIIFAVVIYVLS